ncbi:MAG: tRNA (adenosine(37)-N6)-threonylcarbamoyltransferase complex dimerization subunit type 1 TsaB [Pseudomonadota bacterium]
MSDTILALDSSGGHCAVALLWHGQLVFEEVVAMTKGQAEMMPVMIDRCLNDRPKDQIDRIAVGIGPGNFTGTRVAVALARGIALALGRPAISVSNFELLFDPARVPSGKHTRVLPGPQNTGLAQDFEGITAVGAPYQISAADNALLPEETLKRLLAYGALKPISARPAPLYVRPPDAALPATPPPRHLR